MKPVFPIVLFLVLSHLNTKAQAPKDNSAIEPKTSFEVFINGKKYRVSEGDILKLDTTISNPSISIKISDRKKFETPAIAFEYPRHMSFEFEKDTGYKNWTFNGNSLVVMLFEIDAKTSLSSLVEAMTEKFGRKNCTIEDFQKELGHKLLNGKKIRVTLAGTKITMDFYQIISDNSVSRFISFQDTIKDNGDPSDEFKSGFDMINTTITYNK